MSPADEERKIAYPGLNFSFEHRLRHPVYLRELEIQRRDGGV